MPKVEWKISLDSLIYIAVLLVGGTLAFGHVEGRQNVTDTKLDNHIRSAEAELEKKVAKDADAEWKARVLEQLQQMRSDIADVKRAVR